MDAPKKEKYAGCFGTHTTKYAVLLCRIDCAPHRIDLVELGDHKTVYGSDGWGGGLTSEDTMVQDRRARGRRDTQEAAQNARRRAEGRCPNPQPPRTPATSCRRALPPGRGRGPSPRPRPPLRQGAAACAPPAPAGGVCPGAALSMVKICLWSSNFVEYRLKTFDRPAAVNGRFPSRTMSFSGIEAGLFPSRPFAPCTGQRCAQACGTLEPFKRRCQFHLVQRIRVYADRVGRLSGDKRMVGARVS